MPYPEGLTRWVASGELGRTEDHVEIWTCTLTTTGVAVDYVPFLAPDPADGLGGFWNAWRTYLTTAGHGFLNNMRLTEVMAAGLNPDGSLVGGTYQRYRGTPVSGPGAAPYVPFQQTLCVTLDAGGSAQGRFGRFYPPPQKIDLPSGDGLIASATAATLAAGARTLVEAVNNLSHPDTDAKPFRVVVASAGRRDPATGSTGPGSARPVTSVRVGRAFDTQRRRRNKLGEGYASTGVAPA